MARTATASTKTRKSTKTASAGKRTKTAPAKAARATKAPAAEKEVGTCLFTGQPTSSKRSRFLPGHDAKLKSVLLKVARGEAAMSAVPRPALKVLQTGEPLVGFKLTEAGNLKIVGNFAAAAKKTAKKAKSTPPSVEKKARRSGRRKADAAVEVAEEVEEAE